MNKCNHFQKLFTTLGLAGIFCLTALLFPQIFFTRPASAEEPLLQTDYALLNQEGNAYEVNVGEDDSLYVSDNKAGEIWHFSADGNALEVFGGLGLVSDARPAADGMIWFVDQTENDLVRLDPLSASTTSWEIPGDGNVFGTNVDDLGNIWVTKFNHSSIFRLTPGEGKNATLCEVDLSSADYSGSDYIVDASGNLWLEGYTNQIIFVQPGISAVDVTSFSVSTPGSWVFDVEGLVVDGTDGLWFADTNSRSLVHLVSTPAANFLRFSLPSGAGTPYMITLSNGQIWYSGYDTSVIGKLDPALVSPTSYEATINQFENIPMTCSSVAGVETTVTSENRTPDWISDSYPITELTGWTIVNLYDSSIEEPSFTWGIAKSNGHVWVVDQGRQVLMRTPVDATITACKFSDTDGKLATADDRTTLAGWGMTLYQDDNAMSTQLTAESGCTSWTNLPPGPDYRVVEEQRDGWAGLEPASGVCQLGTFTQVGEYKCNFINWKEESNIFLPLVIK
jgi:streptogramin lyase